MANRGDMNLAKELRAEFGRAKPPRRKGQKLGNQFGNELRPTPPYHREQFDRVKSNRDEARGGQLPSGRQNRDRMDFSTAKTVAPSPSPRCPAPSTASGPRHAVASTAKTAQKRGQSSFKDTGASKMSNPPSNPTPRGKFPADSTWKPTNDMKHDSKATQASPPTRWATSPVAEEAADYKPPGLSLSRWAN